jgi:hypothetical protein
MPSPKPNARPLGPYSRPTVLAKRDQRTREARLLREARAELTAHVGGNPSATQRALIDQAAQLRLRLACMDRKFAESGAFTEHDSRTYLAWSNSYTRALAQLGMKSAEAKGMSLTERLAAAAAARAAGTPPAAPGSAETPDTAAPASANLEAAA